MFWFSSLYTTMVGSCLYFFWRWWISRLNLSGDLSTPVWIGYIALSYFDSLQRFLTPNSFGDNFKFILAFASISTLPLAFKLNYPWNLTEDIPLTIKNCSQAKLWLSQLLLISKFKKNCQKLLGKHSVATLYYSRLGCCHRWWRGWRAAACVRTDTDPKPGGPDPATRAPHNAAHESVGLRGHTYERDRGWPALQAWAAERVTIGDLLQGWWLV